MIFLFKNSKTYSRFLFIANHFIVGHCVIFNNKTFVKEATHPTRTGTDKDKGNNLLTWNFPDLDNLENDTVCKTNVKLFRCSQFGECYIHTWSGCRIWRICLKEKLFISMCILNVKLWLLIKFCKFVGYSYSKTCHNCSGFQWMSKVSVISENETIHYLQFR